MSVIFLSTEQVLSYSVQFTYPPPGTPASFWDNFNVSVERALESNSKLINVGDFNQNLLNPNEYHLTDFMALNNLKNVINKAMRVTTHSSTLLDPILVSFLVNVLYSDTIDVEEDISDHRLMKSYLNLSMFLNHFPKEKFGIMKGLTLSN